MTNTQNQRGSVMLALMGVLGLLLVSGLGIWGFLHHWRTLTQVQLQLDRCVGRTALELASKQNQIVTSNREIRALRISRAASTLLPAAIPSIEAALAAEVIRQTALLAAWEARRAEWLLHGGCPGARGLPTPLPRLPWIRDPPDPLGPQELRWIGAGETRFRFKLQHSPRIAGAWVYAEGGASNGNWKTSWTYPLR